MCKSKYLYSTIFAQKIINYYLIEVLQNNYHSMTETKTTFYNKIKKQVYSNKNYMSR